LLNLQNTALRIVLNLYLSPPRDATRAGVPLFFAPKPQLSQLRVDFKAELNTSASTGIYCTLCCDSLSRYVMTCAFCDVALEPRF